MFQIIKNGEVIAIVEEPRFIRIGENGSFVQTDEENAQGIAVNSIPYNLSWLEPMEGVAEAVTYNKVDGGEYILQQQSSLDSVVLTMLEVLK